MKKLIPLIILINFSIKAQDVKIGTQTWTTQNLNVSTYQNGDTIPQVQDATAWDTIITGAWCYYDNDPNNGEKYGKLYNWAAVSDFRGLAPKGYHLPTFDEWTILKNYLGGDSVAGKKMKTLSGWQENGNGTNTSGFSGLPGGCRSDDGLFAAIGHYGSWWSYLDYNNVFAPEHRSSFESYWYLSFRSDEFESTQFNQGAGLYIRCIKD